MDRNYRDKMVRLLLNILVSKEPVLVKELEPGLDGVAKFTAEFTKLSAKEIKPYIRYMKEKGWIAFEHIQGEFYFVVTSRGKKHWAKQQIAVELPKKPLTSAKWLVVMFDIPNKHKTARDKFRKQLLSWGFVRLMESTFVTPYEWRKPVENLRMLLGVAPYVRLFEATNIERDHELKRIFQISSPN
jgi:DNA-binding transcriptional regulator PaaX